VYSIFFPVTSNPKRTYLPVSSHFFLNELLTKLETKFIFVIFACLYASTSLNYPAEAFSPLNVAYGGANLVSIIKIQIYWPLIRKTIR
jgi:hypothetical protein